MKVKDNLVSVMRLGNVDYISLTDLAKFKNDKYPANVIIHWLSNKDTSLYVGLWEELNNENFNLTEYREIKINKIREFERLKKNESYQNKIEWSVRRELAKTNYRIHTDSIKENLVPTLTEKQKLYVYANEADILNVALFGMTAKEWKDNNPELEGNMRDYANILQLVILINLENLNAEMIEQGLEQSKRLERLNTIAKKQYLTLQDSNGIKKIEALEEKEKSNLLIK